MRTVVGAVMLCIGATAAIAQIPSDMTEREARAWIHQGVSSKILPTCKRVKGHPKVEALNFICRQCQGDTEVRCIPPLGGRPAPTDPKPHTKLPWEWMEDGI